MPDNYATYNFFPLKDKSNLSGDLFEGFSFGGFVLAFFQADIL